MKTNTLTHAAVVFALAFSQNVFAVAGKFQFVNGEVQVLDASGKARAVKKGDAIDQGETVTSGANGFAQIRMEDGGFFAVRPDTEFKIDAFKYEGKEDGSEQGIFSLVKGSLRSVTGAVGKKHRDNYKINTATATIGIRGSGADVGHGSSLGTAVRTLFGGHSLTSGGKTLNTGPGQTAMTPPGGGAPQYVPNFPFNTSTTGGGNGNNDGGNEGGGNSSQNSANNSNNANNQNNNPGTPGDKVVIPMVAGDVDFTNLARGGLPIGGGGDLPDPVGNPGPLGSGGVTLGLVQYSYGGNTFTFPEQGAGVVDNVNFFSFINASNQLVGWKDISTFTDEGNGSPITFKTVTRLGNATVVQDGADIPNGVIWGRWSAGWQTGYVETHNGVTEVFTNDAVGGLAFISASHITTNAELANHAAWSLGNGLLDVSGEIKGYYNINGANTFPTAFNGVADGGHITSANAIVNFSTGHITTFNVAGNGGAFGSWNAGLIYPAVSISDFKTNGAALTGGCSYGTSAACGGMGNSISGQAVGLLSGNQAQGIISTVGLTAVSGSAVEHVGGAVYLQRNAGAVP